MSPGATQRFGEILVKMTPGSVSGQSRIATRATTPDTVQAARSGAAGLFVIAGASGKLASSSDGETFTLRTSSFGTTAIRSLAYAPALGRFCAIGQSGKIATSDDGETWTQQVSGMTGDLNRICWSPELTLFCVIGSAGKVATSPDGIAWTVQTPPTANNLFGVGWSGQIGLFVAHGGSSGTPELFTSPTGVTWTSRSHPFSSSITGNVAASPVGRFALAGSNGMIATSTDGITWSSVYVAAGTPAYSDIAWANGLFIAGAAATAAGIFTSPDGLDWTRRANPAGFSTTIKGVAWSPRLQLWIITGTNGSLATSPDGVGWISRTSGFGSTEVTTATAA